MVPPAPGGIKYYFSLQNPKNFKRETFIDQKVKKVFVEDENSRISSHGEMLTSAQQHQMMSDSEQDDG